MAYIVKSNMGDTLKPKIIQMFGEEKTKEWEEFLVQRDKTFTEFLLNKELNLSPEKIIFKDKEKKSPEQVNEIYRKSDAIALDCRGHIPFHSEEFISKIHIDKTAKMLEFGACLG
ncbi:MAG: hypothetical protein KAX49_13005 [Halanaerobiales bacterium]|nr:hypothetical protein [Halanaerobiales bacterium]